MTTGFSKFKRGSRRLFGLSPWLVMGVSVILGLAIIALAARTNRREKDLMSMNMLDRANALIWSLEAGTRTWMGSQTEKNLLQMLVEETAKQPGIVYLTVANFDGTILAHSDTTLIGEKLPPAAVPTRETIELIDWRMANSPEAPIFDVYSLFAPVWEGRHRMGRSGWMMGHMGMRGRTFNAGEPENPDEPPPDTFILVGLDQMPFREAIREHFRNTVVTASSVAGIGLVGFILMFWVHSRQTAELRLLQKTLQRHERLSALGNLAAGVAHEIRNPLSTIKGLATYIARKLPPGGAEEEAAKTMISEANRLNAVVSELLEFARPDVQSGEPSDVNETIARALRLADFDIRDKQIKVDFAPEATLPPVRHNPERLTQALLNLFLNAVQAMEPGGTLTVRTKPKRSAGDFRIIVSDTGSGMADDVREAIFNPYFTTKPSGTGLGLAIVHRIAEGHGGRVTVESAPGAGSAFTIHLPL